MQFCFLLATVFVLEVIVGLVAYVMRDQIEGMLVRTFNQTMSEYKTDPSAANAIDTVQYQVRFYFESTFSVHAQVLLYLY